MRRAVRDWVAFTVKAIGRRRAVFEHHRRSQLTNACRTWLGCVERRRISTERSEVAAQHHLQYKTATAFSKWFEHYSHQATHFERMLFLVGSHFDGALKRAVLRAWHQYCIVVHRSKHLAIRSQWRLAAKFLALWSAHTKQQFILAALAETVATKHELLGVPRAWRDWRDQYKATWWGRSLLLARCFAGWESHHRAARHHTGGLLARTFARLVAYHHSWINARRVAMHWAWRCETQLLRVVLMAWSSYLIRKAEIAERGQKLERWHLETLATVALRRWFEHHRENADADAHYSWSRARHAIRRLRGCVVAARHAARRRADVDMHRIYFITMQAFEKLHTRAVSQHVRRTAAAELLDALRPGNPLLRLRGYMYLNRESAEACDLYATSMCKRRAVAVWCRHTQSRQQGRAGKDEIRQEHRGVHLRRSVDRWREWVILRKLRTCRRKFLRRRVWHRWRVAAAGAFAMIQIAHAQSSKGFLRRMFRRWNRFARTRRAIFERGLRLGASRDSKQCSAVLERWRGITLVRGEMRVAVATLLDKSRHGRLRQSLQHWVVRCTLTREIARRWISSRTRNLAHYFGRIRRFGLREKRLDAQFHTLQEAHRAVTILSTWQQWSEELIVSAFARSSLYSGWQRRTLTEFLRHWIVAHYVNKAIVIGRWGSTLVSRCLHHWLAFVRRAHRELEIVAECAVMAQHWRRHAAWKSWLTHLEQRDEERRILARADAALDRRRKQCAVAALRARVFLVRRAAHASIFHRRWGLELCFRRFGRRAVNARGVQRAFIHFAQGTLGTVFGAWQAVVVARQHQAFLLSRRHEEGQIRLFLGVWRERQDHAQVQRSVRDFSLKIYHSSNRAVQRHTFHAWAVWTHRRLQCASVGLAAAGRASEYLVHRMWLHWVNRQRVEIERCATVGARRDARSCQLLFKRLVDRVAATDRLHAADQFRRRRACFRWRDAAVAHSKVRLAQQHFVEGSFRRGLRRWRAKVLERWQRRSVEEDAAAAGHRLKVMKALLRWRSRSARTARIHERKRAVARAQKMATLRNLWSVWRIEFTGCVGYHRAKGVKALRTWKRFRDHRRWLAGCSHKIWRKRLERHFRLWLTSNLLVRMEFRHYCYRLFVAWAQFTHRRKGTRGRAKTLAAQSAHLRTWQSFRRWRRLHKSAQRLRSTDRCVRVHFNGWRHYTVDNRRWRRAMLRKYDRVQHARSAQYASFTWQARASLRHWDAWSKQRRINRMLALQSQINRAYVPPPPLFASPSPRPPFALPSLSPRSPLALPSPSPPPPVLSIGDCSLVGRGKRVTGRRSHGRTGKCGASEVPLRSSWQGPSSASELTISRWRQAVYSGPGKCGGSSARGGLWRVNSTGAWQVMALGKWARRVDSTGARRGTALGKWARRSNYSGRQTRSCLGAGGQFRRGQGRACGFGLSVTPRNWRLLQDQVQVHVRCRVHVLTHLSAEFPCGPRLPTPRGRHKKRTCQCEGR